MTTVGEMTNLININAAKVSGITPWINFIWTAPLKFIISLYMLYSYLGIASLIAVASIVFIIPLNFHIARKMEKVDQKKWEINDLRIKMMNEILSGIKVIKLYGWEESFKKLITKVRNNQMNYLREQHYLGLKSECFWDSMPWILMLVAFGSFILLNDSSKFTLNVVFVSVSLFNIIRSPLDDFSNIITTIITLKVSIERLSSFLLKEEINENEICHDNLDDIAVRFSSVSLGWDHEKVMLRNINLDIKKGKLIAIVGKVGSGKSSFLSALLGEMNKLNDGIININGSMAYIPQLGIIKSKRFKIYTVYKSIII